MSDLLTAPTSSLTFPVLTAFQVTWTLTDQNGNPITNANVVANLYSNRSFLNPDLTPGTSVAPVQNLQLVYTGSNGQYAAIVPGTLDPGPDGGFGFTLVIDGTVSGIQVYHDEVPVAIGVAGAGSIFDLTTLEQVKAFVPGLNNSNTDDAVIQSLITAWGYEFLRRTGRGDQGGDFTQSPFTGICSWNETYDGTGRDRLFVRNGPIKTVSSLYINGIAIAASSGYPVTGYVIDGTGKSISLRAGFLGWGPQMWTSWQAGPYHVFGGGLRYWKGVQNVSVQYTGGYSVTPGDIVLCANEVVGQNYKRRSWIDEESRAMAAGGGTIRYRSWDVPPHCQRIVDNYTRTL